MDSFKHALNDAISAWIKLSEEWEKIEEYESDTLTDKYPFDKDFREVVRELMDWKESLESQHSSS